MALDKDIEQLSRVPMLAAMDRDALRLLAFAAEARALRAGDVLFREGDEAEGAVLVVSGAIGIRRAGVDDPRVLGPDALLNEQALLTVVRHTYGAVAREPSTILRLSRSAFLRALEEHPANARSLRTYWARRLRGKLASLKKAVRP